MRGAPTTSKLRVLARGQQVIRVDTESISERSPGPGGLLAALGRTDDRGGREDAVLLSDYGKGVLEDGLPERVIRSRPAGGLPGCRRSQGG